MPSRRSGTRSHHGCQNCKNRHVKCDETFPTCNRCQKRNEVCTLSQRTDVPAKSESGTHTPSTPLGATSNGDANAQVSDPLSGLASLAVRASSLDGAWLDNMLLDHYVRVASWTLNENAKITALYHDTVPEIATRHDHLRHVVLSISGAHCVATLSKQPSQAISPRTVQALVERSMTHQSLGLNSFAQVITRANTSTLSREESIAVTLSSILMLTSYMAHMQPAFQKFSGGDVGAISKAIALLNLQGPIHLFFIQYGEQIAASELKVFEQAYIPVGDNGHAHSNEAAESLARVALLCSDRNLPPSERDKYAEVVKGLADISKIIALEPNTIGGRFRWVTGETSIFMANKIYRRTPEALILLAHWAACQVPDTGSWWGSGFGEAIIREVESALPSRYTSYIAWPLGQLEQATG